MPPPFDSTTLHFVVTVLVLVTAVVKLSRRSRYPFLPGPPLTSVLGYAVDVNDPLSLNWHFKMSDKYGHVVRLRGGFLGADGLYISDPLALHSILVRDQYNFLESAEFSGLFGVIHHGDSLASVCAKPPLNLPRKLRGYLNFTGQKHKQMRKLINPALTASNVSKLVPLFYTVAHKLRTKLNAETFSQPSDQSTDVLDHLARTALELVVQGGIGHSFKFFDRNSKEFDDFSEAVKIVLPTASRLFLVLPYFETWRNIKPVWLRRLLSRVASYLPWPDLQKFQAAINVMHAVCVSAFRRKQAAFAEGGIEGLKKTASGGRDLTARIMQVNAEADEEDRMPDDTVIANMSSIILGGQETISNALSRLLHIMASDPSVQSRLRAEIVQAMKLKGTDLGYDDLNNLPFLDAVCRETLRLFPPVPFVWRQTAHDTVVPIHFPVRDVQTGLEMRGLRILKGTQVYVGIGAANQSIGIWGPDAGKFRPERWLNKPGKENVTHGVKMPSVYSNSMTFLGGGRSCPGMKFALLEMKVVIAVLLPAFSFSAAPEAIEWRMGINLSPYVRGRESEGPKVLVNVVSL